MIVVEASEPPGEGAVNCGIVVGLLMFDVGVDGRALEVILVILFILMKF